MTLYEKLRNSKSDDEETNKVLESLRQHHSKKFWFEYQQVLEELVFKHRSFDSREIIESTFQELQTNLDSMVIMQLLDEYIERRQLAHTDALECIKYVKNGFSKISNALIFAKLLEMKQHLKEEQLDDFPTDISALEKEILQLRNCPRSIYAQLYHLKCDYIWKKKEYSSYTRAVLTFIAYVKKESLGLETLIDLAEKCILSALIGEDLLNFNEVINSELFNVLKNSTEKHYLCEIAVLFNSGKIEELAHTIHSHMRQIENSILRPFLHKIEKNVRVISLCDHIFLSPNRFTHQSMSFEEISRVAKIAPTEVESLLIYVLSTETMKGHIDQVSQTFHVYSIKPRALDAMRIEQLKDKFQAWGSNVSNVLSLVSTC